MTRAAVAADRAVRRAAARRVSLWRVPRARSLLVLGLLSGIVWTGALAAHAWIDVLWFREVGHEAALWTSLRWKVVAVGLPATGTACVLLANLSLAERIAGDGEGRVLRRHRRLARAPIAVAGGTLSAVLLGGGTWKPLLLWMHRGAFGVEDPLFHRDIGFFVFSMPLHRLAARWLLATLIMAAVTALATYLVAGSRPLARGPRAHLLGLGALVLLALAWRLRLDAFGLALPHAGSVVPGASYTDAHVRLTALRVTAVVCVAGAGLCAYAAVRRVPAAALAAVGVLAVLASAGGSGLPALVERVDVAPQELTRERPYLAAAIASTRRAYALDRAELRAAPAARPPTAAAVAAERRTVDNLPLWDSGVLRPAMDELESLARYYGFGSTTVGEYTVDGERTVMTIAARRLDRSRLEPDATSWATDRFAYTHGYGIVALRGGQADAERYPRFAQRGFGQGPAPLSLREPRIFFGEQRDDDPPYVVVHSSRGEVDAPAPGTHRPAYHYAGTGGIALSGPLRRLAFAARFGDLKLLLTETVTGDSRVLLHRDVRERVRMLAPFLTWDARPQTTVVGGRVVFLFDGYTTSHDYPYAAPMEVHGRRINYVRPAARAAVDAYSGAVRLYAVADPDPIMRAWQAAYPGLFRPDAEMPPELRARLRYPRLLFAAQAAALATYHAVDPTAFWNGADAWQRAEQLSGAIERAGEIRFPDDEKRRGRLADAGAMRPAELLARLPGDRTERFATVLPFTPRGRQNLVAYLGGSLDAAGRPSLTLLGLPRDRLTLGPTQATRRILSSPEVNRRVELLNRESKDLGTGAISRTVLGAPRVVPIAGTLVTVQPIYLLASGDGVPRLALVTVDAGGRIGYGRDVGAALRRALPPG